MADTPTIRPELINRIRDAVNASGGGATVQSTVNNVLRSGGTIGDLRGPLPPLQFQPVQPETVEYGPPPDFGTMTMAVLEKAWPALLGATLLFGVAGFAIGYSLERS